MDSLTAKDLQIFREKSRAFCGWAKIPLDKLRPEELPDNPRQLDEKNVARLVDIFHKDTCQPREPDNHVPVLISRSAVPEGLLRVGDDFKLFIPEHPLTYLDGRHRLEAASRFIPERNNRWWIADLFSDDLSLLVKNVLRERDPNCAKYFDGDILRQIRISTIRGDEARRQKWLAKLSKSKQDYVKRLEALPEKFLESLDDLIPLPGLWPAVHIGTFPRLLNLHLPEELTRCLRRIKVTWAFIFSENESDMLLLDPNTAHILQGLCPGLSLEDRALVEMRMRANEIFPAFRHDGSRSRFLERLCLIKHVITSIHTFLEDSKYLEPCSRILKKVLPSKCKGSLSEHYRALHNRQSKVRVQTNEFTFEDQTLSSSRAFWLSYRILWLLTLRHFPVMDGQEPRRDIGKQSTWQPGLQFRWWVELSALAKDNGYKRIRQLYRDHKAADISMIKDCVRRIRPSNYYKIDQGLMQRKVQLIYEIIGEIPHVETVMTTPELTSDHDNCRPDISDRCGRPRVSALKADKGYLFFDYIYSTSYDTTPKRYLTSFAITRDFFHSFFGIAEDDLDQNSSRVSSDRPDVDREDCETMQDVNTEGAPADQQLSLSPREDMHASSAILPQRKPRSPGRRGGLDWRSRSASPDTQSHYSERRRERSASQRERRHRRDPSIPREEDTHAAITSSLVGLFVNPPVSLPTGIQPPAAPMFIFGQEPQDRTISLQEASRVLFRKRIKTKPRSFMVLSPTSNDRFRICLADSTNTASMVNALQLPSKASFLTREQGKRLKLTAPTIILDEARSQKLDTALMVSQHRAGEWIRRFKDCEGWEQDPHRIRTGIEVVKFDGKPITISIWEDGEWKVAKRNVAQGRTEERIRYYLRRYKGLCPYDWEGKALSIDECFDAAQSDFPPTVYLSTPEQATSIFPIKL